MASAAADAIAFALFDRVNEISVTFEDSSSIQDETRSSRERLDPVDEGKSRRPPSPPASHWGYDPLSVRSVANSLLGGIVHPESLGKALVLGHAGVTTRKQRLAVASGMLSIIGDVLLPFVERSDDVEGTIDGLARFIALCAASARYPRPNRDGVADGKSDAAQSAGAAREHDGPVVSSSIHDAATGLIGTLGSIAGSFDPEFDDDDDDEKKPYAFASNLCIKKLPVHLISQLTDCLAVVESFTEEDVALFQSPKGVLFRPETGGGVIPSTDSTSKNSVVEKRKVKKKGGGGFNAAEDEEWERQVKKDLEKKKREQERLTSASSEKALTSQEKEMLNVQTTRREVIAEALIREFPRTLAAIRCLAKSDIEVGNSILPFLGQIIVRSAVSTCEALTSLDQLRDDAFVTLSTLASCVYEIDEIHAPTIAMALVISFQGIAGETSSQKGSTLKISALPSPCAPASDTIVEIDDYGDCLSGNSFVFIFPL